MLIYILFFLIDDIVVFVIAMLTLNIKGISSKYGKYSHLIGGIIMILIGILMIFKPEWIKVKKCYLAFFLFSYISFNNNSYLLVVLGT